MLLGTHNKPLCSIKGCVIVPSVLSLTSEKGCAVWSCCVLLFFLNNVVACRVWRKRRQISWWSKPRPLHWEGDVWTLHSFNAQLLNLEITVLYLGFDTVWDATLVNQPGHEADLSSSSRAACKKWTCTSLSSWLRAVHRDNCTLCLLPIFHAILSPPFSLFGCSSQRSD
jgi:hypothetical protein